MTNNINILDDIILPKDRINQNSILPEKAYNLIKDSLMDEGNARMNLATFCQTNMDAEAIRLMAETMEKNAIDKSEYPETTEIENRCVRIISNLWHANSEENPIGTSTVGSSEACMLGGMAMKFLWQEKARKLGLDMNKKPNIIISSAYQICWKKFSIYNEIELRTIPLEEGKYELDVDKAVAAIDDYTIGIVALLGITYTGKYDNAYELNQKIEEYNKTAKIPVYIHIDAASGGLYAPFVDPDLLWDFKLNNVVSINASGHKYGLVYPGIGWVIWRGEKFLPEKMVFKVSYLGGMLPTIAINFSRSASQIIGQYYVLVRYGFEGIKAIHENTRKAAIMVAEYIQSTELFDMLNSAETIPLVCYKLRDKHQWSLNDLTDRLAIKGWQVPTYPLPENLQHISIQRMVFRADFGINRAQQLITDFKEALSSLENATVLNNNYDETMPHGFTH